MEEVYVANFPPVEGGNSFYVSNRLPLAPNLLIKLPLGVMKPEGWLRHQLELMANGLTGRLPEVSEWCDFEKSAWANPQGEGELWWEELPYRLRGFQDLGYLLGDKRIIDESRKWIEVVLSSQESDGCFGPRENKRNHDLWPNMIMLYALRSFYDITKDARIPTLMARYFRWQMTIPFEHLLPGSWQKWRGGDELDSIYWQYNMSGDPWLLELGRIIHERTADWTGGMPTWHGVNVCEGYREPAQYYQQSFDSRYLLASKRNYETVMGGYGQAPGGMFGADENCREGYTDPRQAAETCSMVEFMHSNEMLLSITGNPVYADRCEEIALNSFPASMTPDLRGLHYLTAPNMVQLDKGDKAPLLQNSGTMLSYDPHTYRCCLHNVSQGWPYYSQHLWMATQKNGLASVLYAPCHVEARVGDGTTVRIVEETDYPFGEVIDFRISLNNPVRFPFLLRIPGWCDNPKLFVNEESKRIQSRPLSYIALERTWHDEETIRLELPMRIRLRKWEKNKNAITVERGPLTYSLKIGEKWVRYGGTDEWPAYEVYPTTPWNYGIALDPKNPDSSFQVIRRGKPIPEQPFTSDDAPIQIVAKGKRIPEWKMEKGLVGLLPNSPVKSDEPIEEITLIPMGCARLRISAFPIVS